MNYKFLIDECLSPSLVETAVAHGHVLSTSVRDMGLIGMKDWKLIEFAVERDFVLVTNNAADFRGKGSLDPGGLYSRKDVHPGLICLATAKPARTARFVALFEFALLELQARPDLINQALEVYEDAQGQIHVSVYTIPVE